MCSSWSYIDQIQLSSLSRSIFRGVVPPTVVVNIVELSLISVVIESALPHVGTSFVSRHIKSIQVILVSCFEIIPLGSCFDHEYYICPYGTGLRHENEVTQSSASLLSHPWYSENSKENSNWSFLLSVGLSTLTILEDFLMLKRFLFQKSIRTTGHVKRGLWINTMETKRKWPADKTWGFTGRPNVYQQKYPPGSVNWLSSTDR